MGFRQWMRWDLDSGCDIPCPNCNALEWIYSFRGEIEDKGYVAFVDKKSRKSCPKFNKTLCGNQKYNRKLKKWWNQGFTLAMREVNK